MGLRPLSDYEYLNISVRGSTLDVSISIDKNGELKLTQSERLTFISFVSPFKPYSTGVDCSGLQMSKTGSETEY